MSSDAPLGETDEQMFLRARAHMEKWSYAASLDRRLWDAVVRYALRAESVPTPNRHADLVRRLRELDSYLIVHAGTRAWAMSGTPTEAAEALERHPQRNGK